MLPETVRSAVIEAFTGVARPATADIALHQCDECAELRAAFAALDWRYVPPAILEAYASKLPLLSPTAYVYFLPAWLLYALEHPSHNAMPTEFLVYDLAPNEAQDGDAEEWRRQRLRALTAEQRAACDAVLAFIMADPEARQYFGEDELEGGRTRYHASWTERWNS